MTTLQSLSKFSFRYRLEYKLPICCLASKFDRINIVVLVDPKQSLNLILQLGDLTFLFLEVALELCHFLLQLNLISTLILSH